MVETTEKIRAPVSIRLDTFVLDELEIEATRINRFHAKAGLRRVLIQEVAAEVVSQWALRRKLTSRRGPVRVVDTRDWQASQSTEEVSAGAIDAGSNE